MLDTFGSECAGINYNYLFKQYSNKLSESWQQFLLLKQQEFNDRDGYTYHTDEGVSVSKEIRVKWLINERKFLKKYSNFAMNDIIKKDFKIFIEDFISDKHFTFEVIGDNNGLTVQLIDTAKIAYEKFLSEADKNTEEYKKVKDWYDALKKDNFKQGVNYYKYMYDSTGNEYYKEQYEKEKVITEYKNLKYNPQDVYAVYQEAYQYCEEHEDDKDEYGNYINAGSGWYEGCISDYIRDANKSYAKIVDTIWDYCSIIREEEEGMVGVRSCFIKEFDKMNEK